MCEVSEEGGVTHRAAVPEILVGEGEFRVDVFQEPVKRLTVQLLTQLEPL